MPKENKYETHVLPYLDKIAAWAKEGATEKAIAQNLGIAVSTFKKYLKAGKEGDAGFKALADAFVRARVVPNEKVENALFRRACGIEYSECTYETRWSEELQDHVEICVKRVTKYIPPDPTSAMFWLTNMMPDKWQYRRTKEDKEETGNGGVIVLPVVEEVNG